jgi:tripartite-type tricarboxylate transporter receptor subunit TctC
MKMNDLNHWHLARRRWLAATAAMAGAALWPAGVQAQGAFPSRSIRLLVPFSAGGGIDLLARITAQQLSDIVGQPVVVENQGGGGGVVASRMVAKAPPDGHTLIFHSVSSAVVNAQVHKDLGYDPIGGFVPISLVAQFPLVLIVNNEVPAKDLREFIALLKANPGKYSYGSSGVGTGIHFAAELFRSMAGVDVQHVPYKGTSAALADLLAGRIQMLIDGVPPQVQNIGSGRVRALGVTTSTRSAVLPNVPTLAESGLAGYDLPFWVGIYAPTSTSPAIVNQLSGAIAQAVRTPAATARFQEAGAEGVGSTPTELDKFWKDQIGVYARIAKASGIKLEQ